MGSNLHYRKLWIVQCQTGGERTCNHSVILFRTSGAANRLKIIIILSVLLAVLLPLYLQVVAKEIRRGQDEDADWPTVEEDILISTCLNETFLPTRLY